MKRSALIVIALAATLHADPPLTQEQIAALTPIDTLPSTAALDLALTPDALSWLAGLATSSDPNLDLGVQLRAIRSLPQYCTAADPCTETSTQYTSLTTLLQIHPSAPTPRDTLRLRAAIEAYGEINSTSFEPLNYTYLTPFLSNASRDIRAAAATAIGRLCNTSQKAKEALTNRGAAENTPGGSQQVVLAISAALRDLTFNCPSVQ